MTREAKPAATEAWLAIRPDRSPGDQIHRLHSLALGLAVVGTFTVSAMALPTPRWLGPLESGEDRGAEFGRTVAHPGSR